MEGEIEVMRQLRDQPTLATLNPKLPYQLESQYTPAFQDLLVQVLQGRKIPARVSAVIDSAVQVYQEKNS
jgi:hypothetical protein